MADLTIDDIEYERLDPATSEGGMGGYLVRNPRTGSWRKPILSHGVDRLYFYAFSIALAASKRTIEGDFCEEIRTLGTSYAPLPTSLPEGLMKRIERFPPEKRTLVEVKIEDFRISAGPTWSEIVEPQDLESIKSEMRFFKNAGVLAGKDDADRQAKLRLSPEQYRKYKSKPSPPSAVALIHVCPKEAASRLCFSMLKDESGYYVWY